MTVDEIRLLRTMMGTIESLAAVETRDVGTNRMRNAYDRAMLVYFEALTASERAIADQNDGLRAATALVRQRTGCSLKDAADRVKQYQAAWGPL